MVASALWLGAGVGFLWFSADWKLPLKPNEWGDVFAGLAAPMAFLWLVLGFLQQGRELKLSTDALMLQVEELKNTVKHQRELVEVSRLQMSASLQKEEADKASRRLAAQPRFVLSFGGSSSSTNSIEYNIRLINAGAAVTNVKIAIAPQPKSPAGSTIVPAMGREAEKRFPVHYDRAFVGDLRINIAFTDAEGMPGEQCFVGTADGNSLRF